LGEIDWFSFDLGDGMKRREFLVHGAAALALPAVGKGAFAGEMAARRGPLGGAQVIWAAESPAVALIAEGKAAEISSNFEGSGIGVESALPADWNTDHHCVFRKELTLMGAPGPAMLHLFCFTRYRLYINGKYVGRGPCRYQNQRPEYDSRDVRALLAAGRNVVTVLAHRDAPTGRIMRHAPGLVAALEVEDGGKRRRFTTDASWLSMPELSFGPRAVAWASIEERMDARKGFDWIGNDTAGTFWRPSVVVAGMDGLEFFPRSSAIQMERERGWAGAPGFPAELSSGGMLTLDLPEIAQAYSVIAMEAEAGSELEVVYGLPQGAESGTNVYVARAGVQTYMGGDTFAMRQLRLRLKSGRMRILRASAVEVRYPLERVGSFDCSDPFLTRLWGICARSCELLSEDSYVDCADRERVEWTDDSPPAFNCTRVMMRGPDDDAGKTHWGDARLLRGLLRRIALTQGADGQMKAHSCSERWDIHAIMEDRSCDWVVQLRAYWESTGDGALVTELWPALTRLLGWFRQRRTERGLVLAREWEVWDNPLRYQVCEGAGLNAMYYLALADAAALARGTGRPDAAEKLQEEGDALQAAFDRLLWNAEAAAYDGALFGPGSKVREQLGQPFKGKIVDGRFAPTAQGNLFALYSGIVPLGRRDAVRKWVLSHLDAVTSPMSHYYLFDMLYAMEDGGRDEEVLKRMRLGWKLQVESEWQTSWEELEDGGGSKAHIYGMHPGYFLTAYVLGIRREGPVAGADSHGERMILIEPRFSGLDWAKGVGVTEYGPVPVEWKRDGRGNREIVCTIPEEVHARLRLLAWGGLDATVEIDGARVPAQLSDAAVEARLGPGRHVIRFTSVPPRSGPAS